MRLNYSQGWFRAKKVSLALFSEEEARKRHDTLQPYCVLVGDIDKPSAFVEINNKFYGVCFLDEALRENLNYQFVLKDNGKLFLQMAVYREFEIGRSNVTNGTVYMFKENGATKIIKEHFVGQQKSESFSTTDVGSNWESLPEFGEYEGLLRKERGR